MSRRRASYQGRSDRPCAAVAVSAACRRPAEAAAQLPATPTTITGGCVPARSRPARSTPARRAAATRSATAVRSVSERRPSRSGTRPSTGRTPSRTGTPTEESSSRTARASSAQFPEGDSSGASRITTGRSGLSRA